MLKILPATFCAHDDGRYAHVNGKRFPVLFMHCWKGGRYFEDMSDEYEYPKDWTVKFQADLGRLGTAVLAKYLTPENWRCIGLRRVWEVQGGNILTCRPGYQLAELKTTPGECTNLICSIPLSPP